MKTCTKCTKSKEFSDFSKDARNLNGLNSWCKACKNEQGRLKKYGTAWRQKNPERSKALKDKYVKENPQAVKNSKSNWNKANNKKVLAKTRKYQAAKLNATPYWLSETQLRDMELIYINCPEGCEVDHIIPLQGKNVKGLHVPWNLQYLTVEQNRRKSNKAL